jgi:hypothetical protein
MVTICVIIGYMKHVADCWQTVSLLACLQPWACTDVLKLFHFTLLLLSASRLWLLLHRRSLHLPRLWQHLQTYLRRHCRHRRLLLLPLLPLDLLHNLLFRWAAPFLIGFTPLVPLLVSLHTSHCLSQMLTLLFKTPSSACSKLLCQPPLLSEVSILCCLIILLVGVTNGLGWTRGMCFGQIISLVFVQLWMIRNI